jgi:hypothetical protein
MYGRYGYRRIRQLLVEEGWQVNVKRVYRIWRRKGLKVPKAMIMLLPLLLDVFVLPFRSNERPHCRKTSYFATRSWCCDAKVKGRIPLTDDGRWFMVQLFRWHPSIVGSLVVIKPETLIQWHWAGFCLY